MKIRHKQLLNMKRPNVLRSWKQDQFRINQQLEKISSNLETYIGKVDKTQEEQVTKTQIEEKRARIFKWISLIWQKLHSLFMTTLKTALASTALLTYAYDQYLKYSSAYMDGIFKSIEGVDTDDFQIIFSFHLLPSEVKKGNLYFTINQEGDAPETRFHRYDILQMLERSHPQYIREHLNITTDAVLLHRLKNNLITMCRKICDDVDFLTNIKFMFPEVINFITRSSPISWNKKINYYGIDAEDYRIHRAKGVLENFCQFVVHMDQAFEYDQLKLDILKKWDDYSLPEITQRILDSPMPSRQKSNLQEFCSKASLDDEFRQTELSTLQKKLPEGMKKPPHYLIFDSMEHRNVLIMLEAMDFLFKTEDKFTSSQSRDQFRLLFSSYERMKLTEKHETMDTF